MQEVVAECGCGNLRNVLMLGDGEHFCLAQIAQRDAVLKRDHGWPLDQAFAVSAFSLPPLSHAMPH